MSDSCDTPCLSCGACCMSYRVSFYWGEAAGLPDAMVEQVTPHIACMAGTNASSPRCAALGAGTAGPMACGVYASRPSPCREVEPGDDKCRRARAKHGMPALRNNGRPISSGISRKPCIDS